MKSLKKLLNGSTEIERRHFVAGAAASYLGVGAMPWLTQTAQAAEQEKFPLGPATAKNVIYVYLSGGMTHLDTFDTKPGAETQGPTESIKTNAKGVMVSEHFPHMAKQMDKVAVVNSLSSTAGAHSQGRYLMHTSYTMRGTIKHPTMGAWLTRMGGALNPALPPHVLVNGGSGRNLASAGFFESKYAPLPIGDPTSGLQNAKRRGHVAESTFNKRLERAEKMNSAFTKQYDQKQVRAYHDMYSQAIGLMGSADLAAFDINKESADTKAAYGDNAFGQGCLLARRLVEHNVRFVEVVSGGWDTHNQNFDAMDDKCPPLDQGLAALLGDLEARGLLDSTLVVLATEFGRTPVIVKERMGRNHYPKAFTCLLAGGGIHGGIKYGKTDPTGQEVVENKVSIPDFNATIATALGLPLEHIIFSPSKRPFYVAHKGKPVKALFA